MKIFFLFPFLFFLFWKTVYSQKDTILLKEIYISSTKNNFSSGINHFSFDSIHVSNYRHESLSDLLNDNSAVFLKSYGPGTLSTISLRGGSAYHTAILWNGFSLASPLHGLTDLSLINNFFFNDVSLQCGGTSSIWGSGSVSGSVHMNNIPYFNSGLKISVGIKAASHSDYTETFSISTGSKIFYSTFKLLNRNADNNFTYRDENTGLKKNQVNATIKQSGFMNENYFLAGKYSVLNLNAWYTNSNRQIPPAIQQVNSDAFQKDLNTRISAGWNYRKNNFQLSLRSAYFKETVNYNDNFQIQPSDNKSKSFINEITFQKNLLHHSIQIGVNNTFSIADSSANFSRVSDKRLALFSLYKFHPISDKFEISLSGRQEFSSLNNSPFIFSSGLNLHPFKRLNFLMAFSRVYRNPTLNDLYWIPGGNPYLKPETGFSAEAGFTLNVLESKSLTNQYSSITIQSTIYYKKINDWIIWYPSSSFIWRPQNLMEVKSQGIESHLKYLYVENKISTGCDIEYFYTLSTNEKSLLTNDASLHRQLIYIPKHRLNIHLFFSFKSISLSYNHTFTGIRYTSSDNSYFLNTFSINNIQLNKIFRTDKSHIRIFLSVRNLFDTDYQSVLNRPMPLRTYEAGITYTFNSNHSKNK